MKSQRKTVLWLLMLCIHPMLIAQTTDYNPNNPPEPENLFTLHLEMNTTQGGSVSGAGAYPEGKSVWVSAYVWGGHQFLGWTMGDSLISSSTGFNFIMPSRPVTLKANFHYNPGNPIEPQRTFTVKLFGEPVNGGYFFNDNIFRSPGSNYNIQANPYSGYTFTGWYRKDSLISTDRTYSYTTGYANDTLLAHFEYTPGSPNEPNTGTTSAYNLSLLNISSQAGRSVAVPIHLFNQNFAVSGATFILTFPNGINVDIQGANLSSRKNGHELSIESMGNQQYFVSITEANASTLSGSSGIIMTIPVVLSDTLIPDYTYPINFSEAFISGPEGNINCPAKNGGFTIKSDQTALYASFYPDIFLNRARFINLSAESAQIYNWDFGDGETSTDKEPLHIYKQGGSYQVKLKVSSGLNTDSATFQILINPSNQWKAGGHFSLNPDLQDVKNFSSLFSMFELFDKASITSDLWIDVGPEHILDYPMTDTLPLIIDRVANELFTKKFNLKFSSIENQNMPVINFIENLDQTNIDILRKLWKSIELNRVKLSLENFAIDINSLKQIENQTVCSGLNSDKINFKQLNHELTYQWTVSREATNTLAYIKTGIDSIPSMELINSGLINDTIIYAVDADIPNTSFNTLLTHQIIVKPLIVNIPVLTSPLNNTELSTLKVDFYWNQIVNTTYDLYLWEAGTAVPEKPTFGSIQNNSFTSNGLCKYGKTYRWRILARGECNEQWSDSMQFTIRTLPDLQVVEINYPDTMFAGDKITVKAKIKNSFGKVPNTWWRDELALSRTAQLEGIVTLQSVQSWRALNSDSTYIIEFNTTLPLDTIKYTYFIVKTDVHNNVLEENETNNIQLSEAINIQKPVVQSEDYALLKKIYNQQNGANWKRKWKINSNVLIAENWPGISFNRGQVTDINLQDNNAGGALSGDLFRFKQLNSLNLGYNQFTAVVDTMRNIANDSTASLLKELYLHNNQLTGELSAFVKQFNQLEKLNVSSNSFSLDSALSAKISYLNLNYQHYQVDSAQMRKDILFDTLPAISRYNHQRGDFNDNPGFHIYYQDNWVGSLSFWNGTHRLSWDNYKAWQLDSGTELEIRQYNGYAYGSTSSFKLLFRKGDNNIDGEIDLLDIQHGINFLLLKYPDLFNWNAANTYPDEHYTVQDIVTTINMVLNQSSPVTVASSDIQKAPTNSNELYFEGSHLILNTKEKIAALDITLGNCDASQLTMSEELKKFSTVKREKDGKLRILAYSLDENMLPDGKIELGLVENNNANVLSASACDINACRIPININNIISSGMDIPVNQFTVAFFQDQLQINSDKEYLKVEITLYDLNGIKIAVSNTNLNKGIQFINWNKQIADGLYLIQIKSEEGNVQYKLLKQ